MNSEWGWMIRVVNFHRSVALRRNVVYRTISIVLVFLIMTSCEPQDRAIPTAVPSQSLLPLTTLPVASSTPNLASPFVSTESKSLNITCLDVLPSYSWSDLYSGTLILASPNLSENYFLDMSTGERYPIAQDDLASNFNVSPNGEWIAYLKGGKSISSVLLVVQSFSRQEILEYPINYDEWQTIAYWLDNETLVLWNHLSPLDSIILFNPFTGEKDAMGNEYPDILPEDIGYDFSWPSLTIYAPSLKYLVYVGIDESGYKLGYNRLILWDRIKYQAIAEIPNFGYTLVRPLWKSDGSGLVFVKPAEGYNPPVMQDELFFLDLDGRMKQLTTFSSYFHDTRIYSYSWSPDERFLAFEVVTDFRSQQKAERRLFVLNMSNLEITDYCLSPEQFTPLVWSPDSRQLAFSKASPNGDLQTVVVDIVRAEVYVVAESLKPAGWLLSK